MWGVWVSTKGGFQGNVFSFHLIIESNEEIKKQYKEGLLIG